MKHQVRFVMCVFVFVEVIVLNSLGAPAQHLQIGDDIDGEAAEDRSGWSVSLSGDGSVVAIGAYFNDGTATDAGHVRIYQNQSETWARIGNDIDGKAAGDQSGWSVDLNAYGTVVAIGAGYNDGAG